MFRLRTDRGGENMMVGEWMESLKPGSFISGVSVHNLKIERFWLDLRVVVLDRTFSKWKPTDFCLPRMLCICLRFSTITCPELHMYWKTSNKPKITIRSELSLLPHQ